VGGEDSRKINWINWESICTPKEDGGLGAFNVALVDKWCWRMLMELEGLWYRVLKARYRESGGRLQEGGRFSSSWWQMLCRVREGVVEGVGRWFDNNIRREVVNGRNTLFWYDTWVGEVSLCIKFPRLFDLAMNKYSMVEEIWRLGWSEGGGAWSWRRRLLAWEEESVRECSLLLLNVVLQENVTDTWRWLLDPIKGYTVREAYRFLTTPEVIPDMYLVDNVWHQCIPSKVSLFVWCLLRNRLPTKDNLVRRRVLHLDDSACISGCQ